MLWYSSSVRSASPCSSSREYCSRSCLRRRCARSAKRLSSRLERPRPETWSGPRERAFFFLAVLSLLPEHVGPAAFAVEHPAQNEQQIRKPVQIDPSGIGHFFRRRQGDERALGTAAHGAREMRQARRARSAREDEFLEPGQPGVQFFEERLDPLDLRAGHRRAPGNRHVAAKVEQVVLDALELCAD